MSVCWLIRAIPVFSQLRMLSDAEVLVFSALRHRHTDRPEAFSETNASLYAVLPEAVLVATAYFYDTTGWVTCT